MDVLRLDATSYRPDEIVEGYSSMIWTERQDKNGEFQLKTTKVSETRDLIPEDSLITLLDSSEVMIVETHSIAKNSDNAPELTVSGRTFETFLSNRAITLKEDTASYTTSEVIAYLLDQAVVSAANAKDDLPNVSVTDSTTISDVAKVWTLDPKDIYALVTEFLPLAALGLRIIRPTVDGDPLRMDIYNGLDRSKAQVYRDPVIFHYNSGHIEDPSYLFSNKDYKNFALVRAASGLLEVWPGDNVEPTPAPTGRDRKAIFVDASSSPDAEAIQKGQVELKKHNKAVLFDGAISPISPYKYGVEYSLGDIVTLSAEYGFEASMLVTEYVRTEDQDGDRGYPTLVFAE